MKKAFYCSLVILFGLLLTIEVNAQKFHIGATTGINTTFLLDKGLAEDPRYNATYTYSFSPIGLAAGVDFGPGLVCSWSLF